MKQQNQIPNVKTLICYDTVDPAVLEKVQSVGLTLIKWQDIIDKDYNKDFNQDKMRFKTIKEIDSDVLNKVESILNDD